MSSPGGDRGGLVSRAHPFTAPVVTVAVTLLAFLLPAPLGPVALFGVTVVLVLAVGSGRAVVQGAMVCLPLWFFLFLLHGLMGPEPRFAVGVLELSATGGAQALAQGGRLGAIVTATLGMYDGFRPSRFIDAVAARGWPFHWAYLLVATITAVPRLVAAGRSIREAQRARGLRVTGSVRHRLAGLRALALPLLFGALAEVDGRTLALETRAVHAGARRTPLDPPADRPADRAVRWLCVLAVVAALGWRVVG